MIDKIKNIGLVLGVVMTLLTVIQSFRASFLLDEKARLESNLYSQEKTWTDSLGVMHKEVFELKMTRRELQNINAKKTDQCNAFEKKIKEVTQQMQVSKMRNIESAGMIKTQTNSENTIILFDSVYKDRPVKIAEVLTPMERIEFRYDPKTDSLNYKFQTRTDVYFSVIRKCKLKDNGKKHWPAWGKIWGWDMELYTHTMDSNSKIIDATYIRNVDFKRE